VLLENLKGDGMTFINRIAVAAFGVLLLGSGLIASPAQAGYVVTLQEVGSDVVATGSGPIDLTGLTSAGPGGASASLFPAFGQIFTGGTNLGGDVDLYDGISGPTDFGFGDQKIAGDTSGDLVGVIGAFAQIGVPAGYVSGAPLPDTSTYFGQTFDSLGVFPGTYEWTWGEGANQNFTLIIGTPVAVPEPPSAALLGVALAGLPLAGRRARSDQMGSSEP